MKKLLLAVIGLLSFSASSVLASKEYNTAYESTYTVLNTTKTQVSHKISITNNLANIYATNYTIVVGSNQLEDIKVSDENGNIDRTITTSENSTKISIEIEDPAIGREQTKTLTISYINPDIIETSGKIWEINIPRLSNANEINQYTRILNVPNSFSKPSTVIPEPSQVIDVDGQLQYIFKGHQNDSITLFFGDTQYYDLDLRYYIKNPSLSVADTEIAIPPDTEYQKIYLNKIEPKPKEIVVDKDGNWLAIYGLEPQQELIINASLTAEVYAKPTFKYPSLYENLSALTLAQKYWDTETSAIETLATQLKNPKNIYDYLLETYVYNYSRIQAGSERLGASTALKRPTDAICTEFTDTFVALTRKLEIPAREINGYAHTTNNSLRPLGLEIDVLHAWPEYFDETQKSWIQIDPTWGSTTGGIDYFSKLDFSHITFVRHGIEDSYPYPAGAYKKTAETKDISVVIVEEPPKVIHEIEVTEAPKENDVISNHLNYIVTNIGNTSLQNYTVELPNGQNSKIEYLPPYAKEKISIKVDTSVNLPNNPIYYATPLIIILPLIIVLVIRKKSKN